MEHSIQQIGRPRVLLKSGVFAGLLLLLCTTGFGADDKRDDKEPFHWARVKFLTTDRVKDKWNIYPEADVYLLKTLKTSTGLNIDTTWYVAPLDDLDEMCKYPFLFMTTEGRFQFTATHQTNLVEYLKRGGFIFVDDCVYKGGKEDGFFTDFRDKIEFLFDRKMVKLPNGHEIYHSFYDLPEGLPYLQGVRHGGHALFIDGRMAIFLSAADIHCGWKSEQVMASGWSGWFPKDLSEDSIKMGVNILMYVMSH